MKSSIIVKKSKIEGKGVFANRDIKKGGIVIRWSNSKKFSKKDVNKLPESEKKYVAYNKGEYIYQQSPARYVNHSCDANTTIKNQTDIAIRDIKKGEEITADYSEDLLPGIKVKCNCGSKNCKGIIVGDHNKY